MMVLGITGGTGCGKTTLLGRVTAFGGTVVDCDAVYHRLLQTDEALLCALERRFPGVVERGELNRKKLGKVVFEDHGALLDLNAITHPYVRDEVCRCVEQARSDHRPLAAIDAVALVESGLGALCDVTVAVTAPLEARVRRLMAREEISEDYARLRIAAQKSDEAFAAQCDRVLYNDCPSAEEFGLKCDHLLLELTGGKNHG